MFNRRQTHNPSEKMGQTGVLWRSRAQTPPPASSQNFGSYSKGKETPESDIDILVKFNGPIGWDFISLNDHLEQLLGNKVDLVSIKALKSQLKDDILSEVFYV